MKVKKNAKFWVCLALVLCLVSMIMASAVQGSWGRVKVSELRLVDKSGYEVSTLLYKPRKCHRGRARSMHNHHRRLVQQQGNAGSLLR